jgi:hypothetical protein
VPCSHGRDMVNGTISSAFPVTVSPISTRDTLFTRVSTRPRYPVSPSKLFHFLLLSSALRFATAPPNPGVLFILIYFLLLLMSFIQKVITQIMFFRDAASCFLVLLRTQQGVLYIPGKYFTTQLHPQLRLCFSK